MDQTIASPRMLSDDRIASARERIKQRSLTSSSMNTNDTNDNFRTTSRRMAFANRDTNTDAIESKDVPASFGSPRGKASSSSSSSIPFSDENSATASMMMNTNGFTESDGIIDLTNTYPPNASSSNNGNTNYYTDDLLLDKPLNLRPSLTVPMVPIPVFPSSYALFPNGRGEARQSSIAVEEIIAGDLYTDSKPAYHQLSMAGEAILHHRYGLPFSSSSTGPHEALSLLDNGIIAQHPNISTSSYNLSKMANIELREYIHHHYFSTNSLFTDGTTNATVIDSSALPGILSSDTPSEDPSSSIGLVRAAARIIPHSLPDPVDNYLGRLTSDNDRSPLLAVPNNPNSIGRNFSTVGALSSDIGTTSWNEGAVSASEYDARVELAAHARMATDFSRSTDTELPLLRIVRPVVGDATDLALASTDPAVLTIEVGGIIFRDHPLFSREDYLASSIRSLYIEYTRRMRSTNVTMLDMRLRSLLAYSMVNNNNNSSSSDGPNQNIQPRYDFEDDSLTDLCARTAAVLETLSQRYEEVTDCAEIMSKLYSSWLMLQNERTTTRITNTSVRLEVKEVTAYDRNSNTMPIPIMHPILYASAILLDRIRDSIADVTNNDNGRFGETNAADIEIAGRLLNTGATLLTRIHENERKKGSGYGCGGLGSCTNELTSLLTTTNNSSGNASSSNLLVGHNFAYPGAREFIFRLFTDESITPDNVVPPTERKRRNLIRHTYVTTEIFVNGKPVAASAGTRLVFPDFVAESRVTVAIRVYRRPASITVRISDSSSYFTWLIGSYPISEVFVPVPGHANTKNGKGMIVDGKDDDGIAALPTSAIEPVSGTYEFSASHPMYKPFYTSVSTPTVSTMNNGIPGIASSGIDLPPAVPVSFFTHQRLTCGDVSVTCAWEVPERTDAGMSKLGNVNTTGNNSVSNGSSTALVTADSTASDALIAIPPSDSAIEASAVESASWYSILTAIGQLSSTVIQTITSPFVTTSTDTNTRIVTARPGMRISNTVGTPGIQDRNVVNAQLGDMRLIREFASLPVPRAMSSNPPTANTIVGFSTTQQMNTTISSSSSASNLAIPGTDLALTRSGSALRRSQAMAQAEVALEMARQGVANRSIPIQGVDPNDPRAIVAGRRMPQGRSTRFRVAAVPQSLLFSSNGMNGGHQHGFGFGALDMAGGALGALLPLPGKQRQQLLRLRSERPDLFRDVHESIPLADEDIGRSIVLRELLRSALVSLGYSEQTADALQYGPLAYLRAGAKALGIAMDNDSKGAEWSGNNSASSIAKTRLLFKIRDFLARVRATPGGATRFGRRIPFSGVVKELSLPALKAFINLNRIIAYFAPRRKLRPRAVDIGIPLDLGPATSQGSQMGMLDLGISNMRGLAPQYRITIQVVRARNVPVRRPYFSDRNSNNNNANNAFSAALSPVRNMNGGANTPLPGNSSDQFNSGNDPGHHNYAGENVVTVVEARFQGRVVRTSACAGSNPQWNEILTLPFIPPAGDVTPARLADVQDMITLSLFDEATIETRADERDHLTTVVRRQRRYLGSVSLPFVALYAQGGLKVEARLDTPLVNLGYRTPSVVHIGNSTLQGPGGAARVGTGTTDLTGNSNAMSLGNANPGHASLMLSLSDPVGMNAIAEANRRSTHLYVHVTVDPPLPATDDETENENGNDNDDGDGNSSQLRMLNGLRFEGNAEQHRLLEYAAKWGDKYASMKESNISTTSTGTRRLPRVVKAIASNIVGEPVLITRYLQPQMPPPDAAAAVAAHLQAEILRSEQNLSSSSSMLMTPPRKGANSSRRSSRDDTRIDIENGEKDGLTTTTVTTGFDPNAKMPTVPNHIPRMAGVDAVARYVSLVPFMADTHAFGSHNVEADLWATSQECLDMGAGDAEEHAIMLHNFLTWFERQNENGGGNNNLGIYVANSTGTNGVGNNNGGGLSSASGPGWHSYILLGRAQPDGETTWVMRQNTSSAGLTTLFINACTGRSYLANDDTCPLLSVGMIATGHNVWANIQPFTEPWRMSFDLTDTRCWATLFTPVRPHPGPLLLPPVQHDILYRVPDTRLASALETEIANAVIASLRAWRPRYITRIRGDVSTALKPLLLELEARSSGIATSTVLPASEGLLQVHPGGKVAPVTIGAGGQIIMPSAALTNFGNGNNRGAAALPASALASAVRDLSAEHQSTLERLVARYRPWGFPINIPFTDLESILTAIKSTGIHRIEDESVQYAVGVAVIPYPNDIFSVWIYAVSLLPA